MTRTRVGVVYGGRSSEHEVSLASAAAVFAHLDAARYQAIPIYIRRDGRWTIATHPPTERSAGRVIETAGASADGAMAPDASPGPDVHFAAYPTDQRLVRIRPDPAASPRATVERLSVDIVFPVVHGPHGEDGTLQGLLELANVPYVGSGVLASALAMDKALAKVVFSAHGLPTVDHVVVSAPDWASRRDARLQELADRFALPVFVKPANLGSSVGITKVDTIGDLASAIDTAREYDRKVIVEAAVPAPREIECAVLGNDEPEASVLGEIVSSGEFYDYDAKYVDDASQTIVPADLPMKQADQIRAMAVAAYRALDAAGMARVDFLIDGETGQVYLNEVNTIPGFTAISMYAKMWEASGLEDSALLDRLIAFALARHDEKQSLRTTPRS